MAIFNRGFPHQPFIAPVYPGAAPPAPLAISAPTVSATYGTLALFASVVEDATARTDTWTSGGAEGFANSVNDGSTSSVAHTAIDVSTNTGGSRTGQVTVTGSGAWTSDTTGHAAGLTLVLLPVSTPGVAAFTLIDTFVSNDLAPVWGQSVGTVTVAGNQCSIQCDASYSSALVSSGYYDIRGVSAFAQVTPFVGSGDTETGFQLVNDDGNYFGISYATPSLYSVVAENGVVTTSSTIPYNATNHAWWRIRESSGTVFFDTSADAVTWVNQWSSTYSFDASSLFYNVYTGVDSGSTGTTIIDNVNASGTTAVAGAVTLGPLVLNGIASVSTASSFTAAGALTLGPLVMNAQANQFNGTSVAGAMALGPLVLSGQGNVLLPQLFPQVPMTFLVELFVNGAWTDITSQVYQRDPITITSGRQNEASTITPAQMTLTLNNRNGQFSPRNPSGPYYGSLGRNTQMRISLPTDPTQDSLAYRFIGEVPAWPPQWDNTGNDVYVQVSVAGITRRLTQAGVASLGAALNQYYAALTGSSVPVAYWPCDDQNGAVTLASDTPGIAPLQVSSSPQLSADSSFGGSLALPVLAGSTWFGTLGSASLASTTSTAVFTAGSGNWIAPLGTGQVTVEVFGGGGGGAGAGGCGGGGGESAGDTLAVTAGSPYPWKVGAGGPAGTSPGTAGGSVNGGPGTYSSFAGNLYTITAKGGTGGNPSNPGAGGTGGGSIANDGSNTTSSTGYDFEGGDGGSSSSGTATVPQSASQLFFDHTDSAIWTAPDTLVNPIQVAAWGSGGGGGGGIGGGSQHAGGGGAGGNFGSASLTVQPGRSYNVTAGTGGAGGNPGFNGANGTASGIVGGNGGVGQLGTISPGNLTIHGGFGGESGTGGGTGGAPSPDAQAATFGGSGATGITTTGGGGGGGASGAQVGGNGVTATGRGGGAGGAAGGADIAGGSGGDGGNPGVAGGTGSGPGGGGAASGGASTGHGGAGADGRVEIYWSNNVAAPATGGGAGGSSGGLTQAGVTGAAGNGSAGGINPTPGNPTPAGAGAGGNGGAGGTVPTSGNGTGIYVGLPGVVPGGGGGAGAAYTNSNNNVPSTGNGGPGAPGEILLSWTSTIVAGGTGGGVTAAANQLRFLMQVPAAGDAAGSVIASMTTTGTVTEVDVIYTGGLGGLQIRGFGGTSIVFDSGPVSFNVDGLPLLVNVSLVQNGANITWNLNTSTLGATGTIAVGVSGNLAGSVSSVTGVIINPGGNLQTTSVGQITVQYTPADFTAAATAAGGYQGETAANRFLRLCSSNGIPAVVAGNPAVSVQMGPQQPDTLMNLLQSCENTDMGQLFEPMDQFGLGYRTLADMSNQAAAVALDYSAGQLVEPLSPTDDDQLIANDVTVQRAGGSSYEIQQLTGPLSILPPPAGINKYLKSYSQSLYTDSQLSSAAGWLLSLGVVDQQRFPQIAVQLARPEVIGVFSQAQAAGTGDLLTVANPPAWMPPETIRQLIVGRTETITPWTWGIEWNCVPALPYFTGVLADPLYSQLDTDGTKLVTGITSTATTFQGAPTGSSYPLWSTAVSDPPFDILMAGERMTVTKITGTASPQTFTVVRSVNGIVQAQAAGATFTLFNPTVLGL